MSGSHDDTTAPGTPPGLGADGAATLLLPVGAPADVPERAPAVAGDVPERLGSYQLLARSAGAAWAW